MSKQLNFVLLFLFCQKQHSQCDEDPEIKCENCMSAIKFSNYEMHTQECHSLHDATDIYFPVDPQCGTSTIAKSGSKPNDAVKSNTELREDYHLLAQSAGKTDSPENAQSRPDSEKSMPNNTPLKGDSISKLMELTNFSEDDCGIFLNQCCNESFDEAVGKFLKDGCLSTIVSIMAGKLKGATKFIKISYPEESLTAALAYFKGVEYAENRPISVHVGIAIDAGGPKRQFFQDVIDTVITGTDLRLFEGCNGKLVPVSSSMTLMSNILEIFGRVISHSVAEGGPAFPYLAPPIYWYLITQSVEKAMQHATILDAASAGIKYVLDKV